MVLDVKVYGLRCANCQEMVSLLEQVLPSIDILYNFTKVYDFTEVMKMGFMTIPVLTINGEAVAVGQVPTENELRNKIQTICGKG